MAYEPRIVKLSDSNKTTDYFPVSVTEAIYHKEEGGTLKQLSEIINELPDTSSFITTEEAQRIVSQYAYSKNESNNNYYTKGASDDRYPQFKDVEDLIFEEIEQK